jgi:hypothetical protein
MNYWAINMYYTLDKEAIPLASNKIKVRITSSREQGIGLRKHDLCLLMDDINKDDKEEDNQQFRFLQQGKVAGVDERILKQLTPAEAQAIAVRKVAGENVAPDYIYGVTVELNTTQRQPILLDDIALSLTAVYRYTSPEIHFQQQVRKLTKADFDTIADRLVYVARTAFGKIANALPRDNKLEFILLAIDNWNTINFKEIKFSDALDFLIRYIKENIISQGEFLVETDNMLRENFQDILEIDSENILDINQIGLVEQDTVSETGRKRAAIPNYVSFQAALFRELIKADKESNFLQTIKAGIAENRLVEERFHKLFKNKAWPIDLTV